MDISSILSASDAASYITTDASNFDNFFEITFDVSNINNLNVNNVYYGFSQNNNVFDNIDFSKSHVLVGKSGEGEANFYINQSVELDVYRHVLWEVHRNLVIDPVPRTNSFFTSINNKNEIIEEQLQFIFDQLTLQGSKLFNEISGNPYEYYYHIEKSLFQIILQDSDRLNNLYTDISLAQQNNPNAQQLTVNLKFSPGDALVIYVNYNINYENLFEQNQNLDNTKSYKIYIVLS